MKEPKRLFDFPYFQAEKSPLKLMMTSKTDGVEKSYSTQEFLDTMNNVSKGLLKAGIKKGDAIALIAHNNRCEWNIMDHAIMQIGAVDIPIYPTLSEEDFAYVLNHSESVLCFVSNQELYEKVKSVKSDVAKLKEIYTFETVEGAKHWSEFIDTGKDGNQDEVDEIAKSIDEDDLATIIYTSGTTGRPKGVMISHKNVTSNAILSSERLPHLEQGACRALSFLPVCHIFERMLHYLYMYNGVSIYFAESLETIKEDLQQSKPHIFTAVPRLLEKFFDGIVANGVAAGGAKAKIFEWAVGIALQWQPDGQNGGFYEFKRKIADKLVYSKIREKLGLVEIKAVASGSAALQPRLAAFFNGINVPVLEGYGLSETSPVITVNSNNTPGMLRIGYVGKTISQCEVKIAEDGEILAAGPNIMMGYYKDPEKTAEVMTGKWFHTGDIGQIDDGFLKITDRKKEMFKTSGGKYVAPQLIENALKESHFIEQAIVVGEGQKFPAALIVPSFEGVQEWCKRKNIEYTTDEKMIAEERIINRIWKDVEKSNQRFGKWERVKMMKLLQQPFTIEGGELTPTLKLKRKPIHQKYAEEIASFYS